MVTCEHNYQVDKLAAEHPHWDGSHLYEQARAIVGAEIASITYNEFLPLLLGFWRFMPLSSMGWQLALVGEEPVVIKPQPFHQRRGRRPAHRLDATAVEQLARHAVRA